VADSVRYIVASAHQLPLPDEGYDLVFGIAILHHLELPPVASEIFRVLRPGGRAIFMEPVRNSAALRLLRRAIPFRAPDVSPFERPLVDAELQAFSAAFVPGRSRTFALPHVNVAQGVPGLSRYIHTCFRIDHAVLSRFPGLQKYGSERVFEIIRPEGRHSTIRSSS
jgi:SAM-dependent methyltransferase